MRKLVIYLLFVGLGLSACKDKKEPEAPFSKIKELKSRTFLAGNRLMDPWGISAVENYLLVANDMAQPLVGLYDCQNAALLRSFLTIGKGPYEVDNVGNMQPIDGGFYLSGIHEKKVLKYSFKDLLADTLYQPSLIFQLEDLPEEHWQVGSFLVGKDLIIGSSRKALGRVLVYDPETVQVSYLHDFPSKDKLEMEVDDDFNAKLYSSIIAMSPDGEKFIFSTTGAGLIDLFKIEGKKIVPVWSHADFYPVGVKKTQGPPGVLIPIYTDAARMGYIKNCATNRYAYSLFSGKLRSERDYAVGDRVRVVSWDGKESFEYHLDRPVKRIAVSPDDKILYGIGMNEEKEPEIYAFDIL